MNFKCILLISSLMLASTAQAQTDDEKNYLEGVVLRVYFKEPGFNFYHGMGGIRFGHKFDKNFAIEGLAVSALGTPAGYIGSVYVTSKVSHAYGVYAKVQSDPSNGYSVYGKVGATSGTVTASAYVSGYSATAWSSGTSSSYGGGVQIDTAKNQYVGFDYMSYYSKNGATISGPSVNFGWKF